MKSREKMIIMFLIALIFAGLYQTTFGNQGAWMVGGLMLFSMGMGWYACKAQEETKQEMLKEGLLPLKNAKKSL